jgi:hypothetical protein
MEAQGLTQIFDQEINDTRLQGQQQVKQMMDQLMTKLKPTKEFETRFRAASDEFLKALETPWTAQDIVDQWVKVYGVRFTDQEIDELLTYYTSPVGKKEVLVTKEALPELQKHFSALLTPIIERATKDYIQRLQLIAKECKCNK